MSEVTVEAIKNLRDTTGAGMMDAKKALVEAEGNMDAAIQALRKRGMAKAAKRADREAGAGVVTTYVHGDKIGVLVEINCETDFVARTDDFKTFARDVAMHIVASAPEYLDPEAVPSEEVEKERAIYRDEVAGKPAAIVEKIVEGKLAKYYQTICLVKQPFVKDPDKTIEEYTTEVAAKVGEKVVVRRYARMALGEAL
ncbi:MAG TPA: translation elongation factor Ts [Candidatus Polarisedimenticolaceae bacterium]|nr:translation elongation factor Ts [Candidatus Polarisedimenticolaceae bacterium]